MNRRCFLRLRRCKSAVIQGLLRGRTVKVRMGLCLRMHSRSFSFQTDQAISTLSVPDIASIKGVMFRVSRRPCQSASLSVVKPVRVCLGGRGPGSARTALILLGGSGIIFLFHYPLILHNSDQKWGPHFCADDQVRTVNGKQIENRTALSVRGKSSRRHDSLG